MGSIAKVVIALAVLVVVARVAATALELSVLPAVGAAIAVFTIVVAAAIGGTVFLMYRSRRPGTGPGGNAGG